MIKSLLVFCLTALSLFAQEKQLLLNKINASITVDGFIDEAWNLADSSDSFFQLSPYYNTPPKNRTVVKVLTNDNSLYALFICFQDPNTIKANAGRLDEFTGDVVSIMFDSFNDERTAYKFAVSASGVKMDSRMLDDARNRDYSWDGVWFADAEIYNFGYVVEIEIPYKSIQYAKNLKSWGLDFDRWVNFSKEDLYWCKYEESEGQRISKFGTMNFNNFYPNVSDLNLELYPVALTKAEYLESGKYKVKPDAGLDIFYNPSQTLTLQFTANPDFAQIEADPYDFNISRYESRFSERRPFFTQGNEIFNPSGAERGSGFYSPLELFYSRRIGKILPDGQEVPLYFGTKVFGRLSDWEYGGFLARTGAVDYSDDGENFTEEAAYFGTVRLKKQILGNSSVGILFSGKATPNNNYGVLDVDGAFRSDKWQLAYQFARSFRNDEGDYAASIGFRQFTDSWIVLFKGRAIGNQFNISQIGYVPWTGTANTVLLTGPRWYFDDGPVKSILTYFGPEFNYEHNDLYTDYSGIVGFNFQFRQDWGFEINSAYGKAKDNDVIFNSYNASLSSWYNFASNWSGNLYGGYSKTYNFDRNWLSFYSWAGIGFEWQLLDNLELGSSYDMFIEGNPDYEVEDITYNARPFVSYTPINDFNVRVYVDNLYTKSSDKLQHVLMGFLLSYNFSPKSWLYLAYNELRDRRLMIDGREKMILADRAAVVKIRYLYYF